MANGEACKHCGFQETEHDNPHFLKEDDQPKVCDHFESEFQHDEECPVVGCNGDCKETIAHTKRTEGDSWKRKPTLSR